MTDASESPPVGWSKHWMPLWPTLACLVLGAVSVLSVLLRRRVPVAPFGSRVDDLLYVRGGAFLAHGQWLGPFDGLTLAKGPGFPAFIALMYRSGVSLIVGEQFTYLLAAAAVAGCVWVVTRRRVVALVAFVILALDPVNFSINEEGVWILPTILLLALGLPFCLLVRW